MKRLILFLAIVLSTELFASADVSAFTYNDTITAEQYKKLDEVTVVASSTSQFGDKTKIFITQDMRRNACSNAQMLGNLANFNYDWVSNRITYNNSNNIIVLVDSVEKSMDAVLNMQHIRFNYIEIINKPTGQYQGYDVLINFHTKPNYEGYEGSMFHNNGFIFNKYTDKRLLYDNDFGSITYTKNKLTVFGWYNLSLTKDRHNEWYKQHFKLNGVHNMVVTNPDGTKNSTTDYLYGNVQLSADYAFSKDNSISFVYALSSYKNNGSNDITINRTYEDDRPEVLLEQKTNIHLRTNEHSLGVFFHDNSHKIKYSSDLNYRFLPSNDHNQLNESTGFSLDNHFQDRMNFARLRINGWMRTMNNKLYLSAGYVGTWKSYRRKDYNTHEVLNTNSYLRNKLWATASYSFDNGIQLSSTFWAEHINLKSGDQTNIQIPVGGNLMLYKKLKGYNWIRLNYDCYVQYPDQSLSTQYGYFTDSLTWRGGNPWLKSNISHDIRIWFDAWRCFNVQAGIILSPNRFCSIAESREGILPSGNKGFYASYTYQNTDYKEYWMSTSFTKRFCTNFLYKADIKYTIAKASYRDATNDGHGLMASTSLNYYSPRWKTNVNVQYRYSRNLLIYPQFKSVSNNEIPSINLQRTFFKNRLDVQLTYSMMFHIFNADHITTEDSPVIFTETLDKVFDRQKNNIVIALRYRFAGGKSVRQYNREMSNEK